MEVNENIWGRQQNWVDIINNYGEDVPVSERIQYASLDEESASTFENYILANKIGTYEPIEQSLCYGALGDKMPLSNISNTAGAVGWRNQEDGATPYRSYTANLQTSGNRDRRTITNYVFCTWNVPSTINKEQYGTELYIKSAQRNDRFHQLWIPDSSMGNVVNWSSSEKEANPTINTKLLARIPVKNMIAIPIVKCLSNVSATGATASYVDLLTYIDPTSNTNYTTHPYVVMVGLIFAVAQNGVTETDINRNLTIRLNTLVITSPSNIMKNMPYYDYGGWDKNARYNDYAYNYASCIGPHYRNQASCILPIMGLINAPIRTDTKFSSVNVKSDREGNWDLFDVRFDIGLDYVATMGGGYDLLLYSWAGKEPEIFTVEDSDPNHTDEQKYQNSTTYWAWHITASNINQFREDVRQATAGFGLFFVEGDANRNLALDDPDMFLGILRDGVGNGEYSHGEDNRNQDQWNWNDMHENPYDPSDPPIIDDNDYATPMGFNMPWMRTPNNLYSVNAVYGTSIENLYNKLWQSYVDNNVGQPDEISYSEFAFNEFLTMNPIDSIVSLKLFPYNTATRSENPIAIKLGKYNTTLPSFPANTYNKIDCGTIKIIPYFGNCWIDRLSEYTLYAPFCGTLRLDPNIYMGKEIHLEYIIDQITGACTAIIQIESSIKYGSTVNAFEDSLTGTCAVDIPITGLNQSTIQAQIFGANQALKNANITAATNIIGNGMKLVTASTGAEAIGSLIQGVSSFMKDNTAVESAQYNLHHNEIAPRIIGSASPLNSHCLDLIPRIIISTPTIPNDFDELTYAETKGYACLIVGSIGDNHGFVQMQNPELNGIAATSRELEMIRSLLAGGIFA